MADYEVGYGRPPLNTRFQPGKSGNPKGRPKSAKNTKALIEAVLAERIVVRENGKTRKVSKLQAGVTQLANKAAGGETRAILAIVALMQSIETVRESDGGAAQLEEADREVLDRLIQRVRAKGGGHD